MEMPHELAEAFNAQVTMEHSSSLAYLQMAAYFEDKNLTGMAAWMRAQSDEEREHGHRFFDFVLDRGNEVRIGSMEAPVADFDSAEAVFQASLNQERAVTEAIHDLYRLATEHGDLASLPFLQTFIEEQNEEESPSKRSWRESDSPGTTRALCYCWTANWEAGASADCRSRVS